jgi:protein-histidine pros-kinase
MAAAESTRMYTTKFIKPQLDSKLDIEFLPQTVPAFAATETLNELRRKFPEFSYKEATLNPTNPRDRTSDWEADIVNVFRNDLALTQVVGERTQVGKRMFYFAKPLQIQSPTCLTCHSTPAEAPPSMVKLYGEANGFGWKLNEIIGAMIVTVPIKSTSLLSNKAFVFVMSSLTVLGLLALILGNLQFRQPKSKPSRH